MISAQRFAFVARENRFHFRIMLQPSPLFQRAEHGVDHAARQEIHRRFAAELVARAALDQPRTETALHRRDHGRPAGLRPDQPQFALGISSRTSQSSATRPLSLESAPYFAALVAISCTIIDSTTASRGDSGTLGTEHLHPFGIGQHIRLQHALDHLGELRSLPFLLAQEIMRFRERPEPAFELLALGARGAAEGLRRDRLQDCEGVLHAVIELLDQKVVQHLAARDRRRHPDREAKPDRKQQHADHADDSEILPKRRGQRILRDAGRDSPAGQRGSRKGREQRHAFERHRQQGCLRPFEHLGVERGATRACRWWLPGSARGQN